MTRGGAQFTMVASTLAVLIGLGAWKGVFTHRYVMPWTTQGVPGDPERQEADPYARGAQGDEAIAQDPASIDGSTGSPDGATAASATGDASDPGSVGSIPFPPKPGQTPEEEDADMRTMAKVTPDDAESTALDEFPGSTVTNVSLEHSTGYLLYVVTVADQDGKSHEIKIDAGNGNVIRPAVAEGSIATER